MGFDAILCDRWQGLVFNLLAACLTLVSPPDERVCRLSTSTPPTSPLVSALHMGSRLVTAGSTGLLQGSTKMLHNLKYFFF